MFYYPPTQQIFRSAADLQRLGENTSWPANPTDEALAAKGVFRLIANPPARQPWQTVTESHVEQAGGQYRMRYTVTDTPLSELKAQKIAALEQYRWERETGGITIGGVQIKTDRESQAKITDTYTGLQLQPEGTVVRWKGVNGWQGITLTELEPIAIAVFAHVQLCFGREEAHTLDIEALATQEAVWNYDFTTGWPEV